MALRWDQDRGEYQYLYDAVGGGLDVPIAPLPAFGTLPFVPDTPQYQGPGPFCPLAPIEATFASSQDAVGWAMNVANNVGRWAQDVAAEDYNPDWVGGFVAVPVLEAHSSVENVCDTGGFNEEYLTYIRLGFLAWNDSPWLGSLIGVALPGMTQNTIGSSSCLAGALDPDNANGQADGVNCVAVVGEPDANGDLAVHELEESSSWNSSPNIAGLNARHITDPEGDEDWAGAHQVREADTIFRNNDIRHWEECEGGGGGGRLADTAVHEAGHFLGLRHSDCVADAMFEGYPPAGHPSKQDFARVQILYPNPQDEVVFPKSIYVE